MEARVCRNYTERWINNHLKPRNNIYMVEGLVIVAAVFMIVLAIGAPRRRHSKSVIIRNGVEGVVLLSFPLLSYTLGLMQQQIIKNGLFLVWAMFLAMLSFGGTVAISVHKFGENNTMKLGCDILLFLCYLALVLGVFMDLPGLIGLIMTFTFVWPLTLKVTEQWFAAYLVSKPS